MKHAAIPSGLRIVATARFIDVEAQNKQPTTVSPPRGNTQQQQPISPPEMEDIIVVRTPPRNLQATVRPVVTGLPTPPEDFPPSQIPLSVKKGTPRKHASHIPHRRLFIEPLPRTEINQNGYLQPYIQYNSRPPPGSPEDLALMTKINDRSNVKLDAQHCLPPGTIPPTPYPYPIEWPLALPFYEETRPRHNPQLQNAGHDFYNHTTNAPTFLLPPICHVVPPRPPPPSFPNPPAPASSISPIHHFPDLAHQNIWPGPNPGYVESSVDGRAPETAPHGGIVNQNAWMYRPSRQPEHGRQ